MLLGCSAVILECVPQAGEDPFVKVCLQAYCQAVNFCYSETILELAQVWAVRRCRWWCLLTPAVLGKCRLQPWQPILGIRTVGDALPCPQVFHAEWNDLLLTPYEMSQFSQRRPLEDYLVKASSPLPTMLHSAGAQVYTCPCGCCKFPFTQARLDSGGLHASLMLFFMVLEFQRFTAHV